MRLLVAAFVYGTPLHAGCPTAADLDRGIVISYSDGLEVTMLSMGRPDRLALEVRRPNGRLLTIELSHGTYMLELREQDAEGRMAPAIQYSYDGELPRPEPGLRWSGTITARSEGRPPDSWWEEHRFGQTRSVRVGDCPVTAFDLHIVSEQGVRYTTGGLYLEGLGFPVRSWIQFADEPVAKVEVVAFRGIE